jgi:hypothetical protein
MVMAVQDAQTATVLDLASITPAEVLETPALAALAAAVQTQDMPHLQIWAGQT